MQQDFRPSDEPSASRGPLKPAYRSVRDTSTPRPLPESPKAVRNAASDSLTSKLQDYRNWWNLPRARPRARRTHT